MAGAFYPPPPSFVGGAQPYAPRLGIAQSGPPPQQPQVSGPLVAATFALLIASWNPGPQLPQGNSRFIYPSAPAASPPPVKTISLLSAIRSTWEPPFVLPQVGADIAPALPIISQPPPIGRASAIRQTWDPVLPLPQVGADVAPLLPAGAVVSQPTPVSAAIAYAIRSTWEPAPPLPPQGAKIAPMLPIISQPQPVSSAWFFAIRSTWDIAPPPSQGAADIAPIVPAAAVSQQIPVSTGLPYAVLAAWLPAWQEAQGAGDIAPLVPAPITPPPSQALLRLLLQSWDVQFQPQLRLQFVYPTIIVPSAPPPTNSALTRLLVSAWDVATPVAQRYAVVTASGPPPQAPPVRTYTTLNLIAGSWPAPWWPQSQPPFLVKANLSITGSAYWLISEVPRPFKAAAPIRRFAGSSPARTFKVLSNMPTVRFDPKDPSEAVRLTFDMTAQLAALPIPNTVLTGIVSVTYGNVFGGDNSLAANGAPGLSASALQAIVPVIGGLNENDYSVRVVMNTSDPLTILELTGILPVRS